MVGISSRRIHFLLNLPINVHYFTGDLISDYVQDSTYIRSTLIYQIIAIHVILTFIMITLVIV